MSTFLQNYFDYIFNPVTPPPETESASIPWDWYAPWYSPPPETRSASDTSLPETESASAPSYCYDPVTPPPETKSAPAPLNWLDLVTPSPETKSASLLPCESAFFARKFNAIARSYPETKSASAPSHGFASLGLKLNTFSHLCLEPFPVSRPHETKSASASWYCSDRLGLKLTPPKRVKLRANRNEASVMATSKRSRAPREPMSRKGGWFAACGGWFVAGLAFGLLLGFPEVYHFNFKEITKNTFSKLLEYSAKLLRPHCSISNIFLFIGGVAYVIEKWVNGARIPNNVPTDGNENRPTNGVQEGEELPTQPPSRVKEGEVLPAKQVKEGVVRPMQPIIGIKFVVLSHNVVNTSAVPPDGNENRPTNGFQEGEELRTQPPNRVKEGEVLPAKQVKEGVVRPMQPIITLLSLNNFNF